MALTGNRIGEVAARTGLSVHAIHCYEHVGSVSPSVRTAGGHRLHSDEEVRRLCAVALLRMAGLPTAEISQHLAGSDWDLSKIIENQLARLDQQLTDLGALRHRLAEVAWANPAAELGYLARVQRALATPCSAHKAVALLPYEDVDEAQRRLGKVFGLPPGPTGSNSAGRTRYASVITGQGLVHFHQATDGLQPPSAVGLCTAVIIVTISDVDRLAEQITVKGGRITHGPQHMPYGVRELGAANLAGHIWCFHQPLHTTGAQA